MALKAVLLDLDGTLLPMDQDVFSQAYFKALAAHAAPAGYAPKQLIAAILSGVSAMVKNDGSKTNEQLFWEDMRRIFGEKIWQDKGIFDVFYKTQFDALKTFCGFEEKAAKLVELLKRSGITLALATNPVFPKMATEMRIGWAGLKKEDFALITTFENTSFCKPNPKYYKYILDELGVLPEEALMIGNDAREDLSAKTLGIDVFLLTDCLINAGNADISDCPKGNFDDCIGYASEKMKS